MLLKSDSLIQKKAYMMWREFNGTRSTPSLIDHIPYGETAKLASFEKCSQRFYCILCRPLLNFHHRHQSRYRLTVTCNSYSVTFFHLANKFCQSTLGVYTHSGI